MIHEASPENFIWDECPRLLRWSSVDWWPLSGTLHNFLRQGIGLKYIGNITNINDGRKGEKAFLCEDFREYLNLDSDLPFSDFIWEFPHRKYVSNYLVFDLDEVSGLYLGSYRDRRSNSSTKEPVDLEDFRKYLTVFLKDKFSY